MEIPRIVKPGLYYERHDYLEDKFKNKARLEIEAKLLKPDTSKVEMILNNLKNGGMVEVFRGKVISEYYTVTHEFLDRHYSDFLETPERANGKGTQDFLAKPETSQREVTLDLPGNFQTSSSPDTLALLLDAHPHNEGFSRLRTMEDDLLGTLCFLETKTNAPDENAQQDVSVKLEYGRMIEPTIFSMIRQYHQNELGAPREIEVKERVVVVPKHSDLVGIEYCFDHIYEVDSKPLDIPLFVEIEAHSPELFDKAVALSGVKKSEYQNMSTRRLIGLYWNAAGHPPRQANKKF